MNGYFLEVFGGERRKDRGREREREKERERERDARRPISHGLHRRVVATVDIALGTQTGVGK